MASKPREPASTAQPSGTVTFLFTDVEGSTQRWERAKDAMRAALAVHDELMRTTVAANGGSVFKTVGDEFCAVFATAPDAIAAALDAQRALRTGDFSAVGGLSVRMALHTGAADERDSDYFGPAVNRVARLLAIGHGGQVLVSRTTADLVVGEMPESSTLRDLGVHQLRDLAHAENVYQLVAPDLQQSFPALRSLGQQPNNLPPQLTSFVGRAEEVAAISTLLKEHRLVTLVGAGGAGKTRCAVQVGDDLLERFNDGVWLIELASIPDGSLVTASVARTLGHRESPNDPLLNTLLGYLKRSQLLLVFDNCEHVIDAVRAVAASILRGCPGVRILATSRESLNIAGEQIFPLPALALPASVALFDDRARAADPRFTITDGNAPFVAEIAARLDGIPLAIELAAARVKVLSPQQLARRLDERLRLLTGGDRSALPRHQTMRALIDWSFDLLSDDERALFRKLSIFAGGFTLESATTVCSDGSSDELAVLELVSSLVDKSLVQTNQRGNPRYRLLESTREYAREKLVECDEEAEVARAHAVAFLRLAEQLERDWEATPEIEWVARAEVEMENLRTALEWALARREDVPLGMRLAGAVTRVWAFSATVEARRWIAIALNNLDQGTPAVVAARLDLAAAQLDGVLGLPQDSYLAAERALKRYRALGEEAAVAAAQRNMGVALVILGRIEDGEALLKKALATFRGLGIQKMTGAVLDSLALARKTVGDLDGARTHYAEARAIFEATGAQSLAGALSLNLAEAEFVGGDAAAALRLAAEALASDRAANFTRVPLLQANMAAYLIAMERYDEARSHAREALSGARSTRHDVPALWALQHLAAVAALQPGADRMRAARLLGYVDERLAARDIRRQYTEEREYDAILSALRRAMSQDEINRLTAEGSAWREEHAFDEALLA
ncbi:MAG: adenylate/guanylate cyclase domain-containing protein [Candidatus Cybelea sp.]